MIKSHRKRLKKPTKDYFLDPNRKEVAWELAPPFGIKSVLILVILSIVLTFSGKNVEVDKMLFMVSEAAVALVGLKDDSQVLDGAHKLISSMLPLQFSETREISRIENFDPEQIPRFTRIIEREISRSVVDPNTLQVSKSVSVTTELYHPFGYLIYVCKKMLETIEIAIWATLFALVISIPLAYFSASNYSPNKVSYVVSRATVSFFRAVPELISAMFLVLAFGFGPIAGIMALAIHSAGFLGKFFAEDIENADKGAQRALEAIGVSKLLTLRYAVLPQVLPAYVAYSLYILDRNIRMATVLGIVGAGGIGQELKGRYDMFEYGHVATILMMIFITVFILDQISSKIRKRIM